MLQSCIKDGTHRGYRPSGLAKRHRNKRDKPVGVSLLTSRYEQGLDLWTGKPLEGENAREWVRSYFNEDEESTCGKNVVAILHVIGEKVWVRDTAGRIILLTPKKNRKTKAANR